MEISKSDIGDNAWRKIGYVAVITFFLVLYIVETVSMVRNHEIGMDYLGFWSAGKIADQVGYSRVYDPDLLLNLQLKELDAAGIYVDDFHYWPVPYLSVFIMPFQLLSKIDLVTSHWLWVILNWMALFIYMVFFTRQVSSSSPRRRLILPVLALIISYPTMFNFVWGQIEVLLVICAGEIIRNSMQKKAFMAGLWIGVLIIKPQLLILVIPALLILRNLAVLKGAFTSGLVLSLISIILSGFDGVSSMFRLILGYFPGMATNAPEMMMNWRMVGLRLQSFLPASWSWIIAACGMGGTLVLCWLMIKNRPAFGSKKWILVIMGLFAATSIFTWHSHIHAAMIMIPFFVYGIMNRGMQSYLVDAWVFTVPAMLLLISSIITITTGSIGPYLLRHGNSFQTYIWLFLNLLVCFFVLRFSDNEPRSEFNPGEYLTQGNRD